MITLDQLRAIMPYAAGRAEIFLEPLNSAMEIFGIDTPARQAAFLAQVAHESGSLHYTRELASGAAYEGRADLGNTIAADGNWVDQVGGLVLAQPVSISASQRSINGFLLLIIITNPFI